MKTLPHQESKAQECYNTIRSKGIVYLAGEVRSGKTLTAILTAEMSKAERILVLTKKAAVSGWHKFDKFMTKDYTITNYEQVTKLTDEYDLLIMDEAHNMGAVGKPTLRVKSIRKLMYNKPAILLSGTPHAETKASLYHQMCVSKYSPFNQYNNFYRFFDDYGIKDVVFIAGRQIVQYKQTLPPLDKVLKPYFVTMTQKDAGIETETEDVVHYIEMKDTHIYNELVEHQYYKDDTQEIICDSDMKLRMTLHQLEFGKNHTDYIKKNFKGKVALMAHFKEQQKQLEEMFPQFDVFSSNKHKEGVDLSMYDDFVIVSSDYSGAGFLQRRQRNVNINNENATQVHHLVVKGAISEQVYKAVSNKKDFNNAIFVRAKV